MLKKQVTKFFLVGVLNTAVYYILYSFFIYLKVDYRLAVLFATASGVLFSFKTFGKFVFHHKGNAVFYKFLFTYMLLYLFNILFIYMFEKIVFNYYVSGFFATVCCAVLSFVLNKWYVFR